MLKAVQQHFPESDETVQGHMRNIKQGIRSTKEKQKDMQVTTENGEVLTIPLKNLNGIYVRVEEAKKQSIPIRRARSPCDPEKAIDTLWYYARWIQTQFLVKQWGIGQVKKWTKVCWC